MSKKRYDLLIYFLLLTALIAIVLGITRFMIGDQIFTQEVFRYWLLVTNVILFIQAVLLLSYYYKQQYWLPFYTGIAFAVLSLFYAIVVYVALVSGSFMSIVLPLYYVLTAVSVVYGLSFLFSAVRKQLWLKAAGILMIGNGLVLVILWGLYTHNYLSVSVAGNIDKLAFLLSVLIPVCFAVHFLRERKTLKEEGPVLLTPGLKERTLTITAVIAGLIVFPLGAVLLGSASKSVYWDHQNFKRTQELAELFEARIFINSKGDTLRYRLLKPLNYDTAVRYPLVVSLPYGGQPGTDTIRQIEGAAAALLLSSNDNRKKYPAFLLVPNCPAGSGWGGIPNYPSADVLVYETIESLDKQFNIDPRRRYVTGISRGGYGAWNFVCTRPDLFAAAIPICGGGNPQLAFRAAHVAIWAFHGEKDRNVPVSGSRDMINAIRKAGGNPRYTEFANEGHNIGYQVETTAGLWDWLFAQQKND